MIVNSESFCQYISNIKDIFEATRVIHPNLALYMDYVMAGHPLKFDEQSSIQTSTICASSIGILHRTEIWT